MPRQPRLDTPGALHHVMARGIERKRIFKNRFDKEDFLKRLAELCDTESLAVYAWVLIPNHFHLLVRTGSRPLASSMRKLLTGYVVNFNRRHKRYGHLFQNRYKSIICEDDPYLLELTRYIHLNPLRAGIVKDMNRLSVYPWSGHSVIMGKIVREWQDTDSVLSYFGDERKNCVERYEKFVLGGVTEGKRPDLVGGGLLRSSGGWSAVLSLRRKGRRVAYDERVLGSSEFVQKLLSEAEEKEKQSLRLITKIPDLAFLAVHIAKGEGIDEALLRSGTRKRLVARTRKLFCQIAVGKLGYSGAEVARFLGVTTSCVNRLAASEEIPEISRYL